jgi:hypothetical protein
MGQTGASIRGVFLWISTVLIIANIKPMENATSWMSNIRISQTLCQAQTADLRRITPIVRIIIKSGNGTKKSGVAAFFRAGLSSFRTKTTVNKGQSPLLTV